MKRNLQLLARYKRKMAWIIAVIITILIMSGVFMAGLAVASYTQKSETDGIKRKIERAANLAEIRAMIPKEKIADYDTMILTFMDDVRIYENDSVIFDAMEWNFSKNFFKNNQAVIIEDFRYLMRDVNINHQNMSILARIPTVTDDHWFMWLFAYTLISAVFVFVFVLFLSHHLANYFFHPMVSMVENLEDFTGNINHEFKTSLAEVISSLELAEITKNYEKSVRQAIESSRRIDMILNSLWHTIQFVNSDYRKEHINLIQLFEDSLREFHAQMDAKNIHFIRKYNRYWVIYRTIDHEPLLLVFRNIFKNAIRYSHDSGKIELTIRRDFFRIKDYGVGIAAENLDKVFGRYFREDYSREWSWIGLALAKKIVERYGWNLEIESEKWKYTEVIVFWGNKKR